MVRSVLAVDLVAVPLGVVDAVDVVLHLDDHARVVVVDLVRVRRAVAALRALAREAQRALDPVARVQLDRVLVRRHGHLDAGRG